ncbi:hypothetical protein Pmani_001083 [Petrolisthes manimaculis]|uniref:Fork-head domain-containing protein n=1 Tax=Petrolisthes manimaculis TaxID=1843537 RepID=A0AAE1QMU7_9EUCA|nr:hypothetical protein Pmani_001083 [Petrolisthes manimaculis]
MLGSDGRESVQVVYMGQDTGVKMKVPTATTTTTVMLHKQTCEGGDNSQRGGAFDSHDATVVNTSYRSSQVPHYSPTQRPLPTTTPEGRIADSGMENSVGSVGQSVDEMCPGNTGGGDDLTSLSWLHSLDMGGMVPHLATPPTPPASPQPHNPLYPMLTSHTSPMDRKRKLEVQESVERIDYSQDGSVKPPYSYAALIGMAMKGNQNKMTLSDIYKWIKHNFAYYKTADPSWQVGH